MKQGGFPTTIGTGKYNKLRQLKPVCFNNLVLLLLQDDITNLGKKIRFLSRLGTFNQLR